MKAFLSLLLATFIFQSAQAQTVKNPPLSDIVILYSFEDNIYSSYLFRAVLGEDVKIVMDKSCQSVLVKDDSKVFCENDKHQLIEVGELNLSSAADRSGNWTEYRVKWNDNVEVFQINSWDKITESPAIYFSFRVK